MLKLYCIASFIKKIITSISLLMSVLNLSAQSAADSFFNSQSRLRIALTVSLKEIEATRNDSLYLKQKLFYLNSFNTLDSIQVGIKKRGNFRSKQCYFPPLWIKIKAKNADGTIFEGNKKLKLVLPCYDRSGNNDLILKEYLCYKLLEEITPYTFQTRLADVDLAVLKRNKKVHYQLKGIFIEDINRMATRLHAKLLKGMKLHPNALRDTCAVRFELFQYMISNTDWSTVYQHNAKLILLEPNKYISVLYDFDMSGLVDAPYSVVSAVNGEQLPVQHVTERIYRGFCRDPEVMEFVRQEFLSKKEKYLSIPDQLKGQLSSRDIKGIKQYLGEFFETIKDDQSFKSSILDKCRVE
jgi:hypothetical protein